MSPPEAGGLRRSAAAVAVALAGALLATLLFANLAHPLLWHDEAETAMFARRVLEYGYPRVEGPEGAVYSLWHRGGVGVDEASGAWTGTPWVQYYVGAAGVALADRVDDLYAKTARVRLLFAGAGYLGLWLWVLAVLPALGRRRETRWLGAALLLLLFAYSTGLLLHLREARYYGLVVLGVGAAVWLFARRQVFGTLGSIAYTALLALLLLALFNTFYPAFTALLAVFGLEACARALRRPGPRRARARGLGRELLPLVLALGAVLPLLGFFDFVEQARGWLERFGTPGLYLQNLGFLGSHLLRYDLLAPALVLRGTSLALRPPAARRDPTLQARLQLADFLFLLLGVYALLVAQTPFLFERYFVVLSPLVSTQLLLDALGGADILRRSGLGSGARRAGLLGAGLALALGVGSTWLRLPEFRGRLQEIREPYRGPLDYVIPYLIEAYPRPDQLVIATNYEGPAFMFYLGSRVTVGFYGASLERDLAIVPDVIVPRPWREQMEVLEALSHRASYRARRFPVENLRWNNNPALRLDERGGFSHRFRTPLAGDTRLPLVILERVPEAPLGEGADSPPERRLP